MLYSRHLPAVVMGVAMVLPGLAPADQVFVDDLIVRGDACIGVACIDGEGFGDSSMKLKSVNNRLTFEDTTTSGGPGNDWQLVINDFDSVSGGDSYFAIRDVDAGANPFVIEAAAPFPSMYINALGNVGLGTILPQQPLHIVERFTPVIRMQSSGIDAPATWDISSSNGGFAVTDVGNAQVPFQVLSGASTDAFVVASNGNVGIGTSTPAAPLEVRDENSFSFFRITAETAPINQSVDVVFTKGPDDRGQLRYNIVEVGDSPQVPEMTLNADGDMTLTGTLITAGGTCGGGCDRVFEEGYDLPTIAKHQAQMWAAGYLPNVGPTIEHQPINLSDKMGRMLNELEHAHIYIGELHGRLEAQEALVSSLQADLAALTQQITTRSKN